MFDVLWLCVFDVLWQPLSLLIDIQPYSQKRPNHWAVAWEVIFMIYWRVFVMSRTCIECNFALKLPERQET